MECDRGCTKNFKLFVELGDSVHLLLQACEDRLISFKVRLARGKTSPKKSWDGVTLAGFEHAAYPLPEPL
jgi:hypothetical protein